MSTNRISDEQARSIAVENAKSEHIGATMRDLASDLLDARRENAALVERNLVLQAKVRGAAVASESAPRADVAALDLAAILDSLVEYVDSADMAPDEAHRQHFTAQALAWARKGREALAPYRAPLDAQIEEANERATLELIPPGPCRHSVVSETWTGREEIHSAGGRGVRFMEQKCIACGAVVGVRACTHDEWDSATMSIRGTEYGTDARCAKCGMVWGVG